MSDHEHHGPEHLAHHFDTLDQQEESSKLGMWVFLATEVLMFGGLFCAYAIYRGNHFEVFEYCHWMLDTTLGAINTVVLLASSLTMAIGVRAAQKGQTGLLRAMLLVTFLGGCGFLGIKYMEYSSKFKHGITPGQTNIYYPIGDASLGGKLKAISKYNEKALKQHEDSGKTQEQLLEEGLLKPTPTPESWLYKIYENENYYFTKDKPKIQSAFAHFTPHEIPKEFAHSKDHKDHGDAKHDDDAKDEKHRDDHHADHDAHHAKPAVTAAPLKPEEKAGQDGYAPMVSLVGTGSSGIPSPALASAGVTFDALLPPEPKASGHKEAYTFDTLPVGERERIHIFWQIYYAMTGLHGLHVIIGMGIIAWCFIKTFSVQFGPTRFVTVDIVGLYWHLVDLIWIFLFPLLYLIH